MQAGICLNVGSGIESVMVSGAIAIEQTGINTPQTHMSIEE